MSTLLARLAGAVAGFALAVVWIAAGFAAAAFCLVAGGLGFAAVAAAQRSSAPTVDLHALRSRLERLAPARRPAPPRRRPRLADPASAEDALARSGYGW